MGVMAGNDGGGGGARHSDGRDVDGSFGLTRPMRTQNTLGPAPDQPHFASRMGQVQRPPHFCASELIRASRIPS